MTQSFSRRLLPHGSGRGSAPSPGRLAGLGARYVLVDLPGGERVLTLAEVQVSSGGRK